MVLSHLFPGCRWLLPLIVFSIGAANVNAEAQAGLPAGAHAGVQWQPVTTELLKTEKPGYGGLCGVVVDHKTGNVIVNLSDKGFYRSEDQGKTWKHLGTQTIKGRTEWPGCLMLDPVGPGKTLVSAFVYDSPIHVSRDGGVSWQPLNKKSGHVDWCAVDWSDPEMKLIFTLKHESGDLLLRSTDGGKSFDEVGKGYGPVWVFDSKTAVVAQAKTKDRPKPGLLRTTDAGKTFQPCGDWFARALPRWHKDRLYWLVDGAILTTTDKGESWKKVCDLVPARHAPRAIAIGSGAETAFLVIPRWPKDGRFGPIFGKDDKHLFLLTGVGIVESRDGGATWSKPIPPPAGFKGISTLTWMEYDPIHDTLYLMKMTSELYRMERRK